MQKQVHLHGPQEGAPGFGWRAPMVGRAIKSPFGLRDALISVIQPAACLQAGWLAVIRARRRLLCVDFRYYLLNPRNAAAAAPNRRATLLFIPATAAHKRARRPSGSLAATAQPRRAPSHPPDEAAKVTRHYLDHYLEQRASWAQFDSGQQLRPATPSGLSASPRRGVARPTAPNGFMGPLMRRLSRRAGLNSS